MITSLLPQSIGLSVSNASARSHFPVLHFYRAAWNAMGILSVRLSVRPSVRLSVKRVHCDKTEESYV